MPTKSRTAHPNVVSQAEWEAAREKLLAREKQLTHEHDQLAAERRRMPMVKIERPYTFEGPGGKAAMFDGLGDGLVLKTNPIAGVQAFTVEAVFRPAANGSKEQRWFHIQQDDAENRVLLEIRVVGDEWFLDSFIKSGDNRLTHYAENFKHKISDWYHVALVFDGSEMSHYVDGKLELAAKAG